MSDNKTTKKDIAGGKVLEGVVVSNKMQKTTVVEVTRFVKHPKYGKFLKRSKRFQAHDENNACQIGDKVKIKETRPLSRHKTFIVIK